MYNPGTPNMQESRAACTCLNVILSYNHQPRTRAWIELYGLVLLFFPFVALVLVYAIPFVGYSFAVAEVSDSPGGLPFRWVIKSVLPIGMALLLLAGLGRGGDFGFVARAELAHLLDDLVRALLETDDGVDTDTDLMIDRLHDLSD